MLVCLAYTAESASLESAASQLFAVSPRVVVEPRGIVWCDAASLDARGVAVRSLELLRDANVETVARAGVAVTPIAAEVAANFGNAHNQPPTTNHQPLTFVRSGTDAAFLSKHPIEVLDPSPPVQSLLRASGIEKCGDLAVLDHESVEVRFGAEGSRLWRLSRADDRRRLFNPMPRTLPEASFEWVDYVLTDPERLIFVINGLTGSVCSQLADRGAGAREMSLVFALANRTTYEHALRPARITASPRSWMRLVRSELERIRLPDAVTGITLRVVSLGGELARQGDLFDRGFATAGVTEEAVAQLLDDRGAVLLAPNTSLHPLVELRTEWIEQTAECGLRTAETTPATRHPPPATPKLTLQLLSKPEPILVETQRRRDHEIPVRCCIEGAWQDVHCAAGPDRVSGGEWDSPFAREYYRCVTVSGRLVWIFREEGAQWLVHGWWD